MTDTNQGANLYTNMQFSAPQFLPNLIRNADEIEESKGEPKTPIGSKKHLVKGEK